MVKHVRFQDFIWCFKLCFLKIEIQSKILIKKCQLLVRLKHSFLCEKNNNTETKLL